MSKRHVFRLNGFFLKPRPFPQNPVSPPRIVFPPQQFFCSAGNTLNQGFITIVCLKTVQDFLAGYAQYSGGYVPDAQVYKHQSSRSADDFIVDKQFRQGVIVLTQKDFQLKKRIQPPAAAGENLLTGPIYFERIHLYS